MKLFNFRNKKTELSPKKTIRRIVDYMPDFYRTQRQFIHCIEFLEHYEFELALDSLIDLADESEHYFSEEFWQNLADVATKMNLDDTSNYCQKQIQRNLTDLKTKTPFGWTTVKLAEDCYQNHISEKLQDEWAKARREKDQLSKLVNKNGVHLKLHGRSGFLYFVENQKVAEVDFELGLDGLIIYFENTQSWVLPKKQLLTTEEKENIKNKIIDWAIATRNAIEFVEK